MLIFRSEELIATWCQARGVAPRPECEHSLLREEMASARTSCSERSLKFLLLRSIQISKPCGHVKHSIRARRRSEHRPVTSERARGTASGMVVGAAQKRHPIEHMFLKPFQPEVNDGRDKERNELGKISPPDDDKTKRPAGRTVRAKTERDRHRAHERGERSHHDGRNRSMLAS